MQANLHKIMLMGIALALLGGCSNKTPDLKTPCVGTDDSPCVRRSVNDWWLHPQDNG